MSNRGFGTFARESFRGLVDSLLPWPFVQLLYLIPRLRAHFGRLVVGNGIAFWVIRLPTSRLSSLDVVSSAILRAGPPRLSSSPM